MNNIMERLQRYMILMIHLRLKMIAVKLNLFWLQDVRWMDEL